MLVDSCILYIIKHLLQLGVHNLYYFIDII